MCHRVGSCGWRAWICTVPCGRAARRGSRKRRRGASVFDFADQRLAARSLSSASTTRLDSARSSGSGLGCCQRQSLAAWNSRPVSRCRRRLRSFYCGSLSRTTSEIRADSLELSGAWTSVRGAIAFPCHKQSRQQRGQSMIGAVIGAAIRNLPVILFVLALALALLCRHERPLPRRLLAWLLLLPIGVTGLWAGFFHVCFS